MKAWYISNKRKISIKMSKCKDAFSHILTFLRFSISASHLITHLIISPKTFLFLHIKYSNVIWSYVYSSSLGIKCFSLLLKNRFLENYAEIDCHLSSNLHGHCLLNPLPHGPLITMRYTPT